MIERDALTGIKYPSMDEVCEAASASGFARSFIGIKHEGHNGGNCTAIRISLVTFEPGDDRFRLKPSKPPAFCAGRCTHIYSSSVQTLKLIRFLRRSRTV